MGKLHCRASTLNEYIICFIAWSATPKIQPSLGTNYVCGRSVLLLFFVQECSLNTLAGQKIHSVGLIFLKKLMLHAVGHRIIGHAMFTMAIRDPQQQR